VQIHPNKLLGVVGDHEDFPIEVLAQNFDRSVLGSASHDNKIKVGAWHPVWTLLSSS